MNTTNPFGMEIDDDGLPKYSPDRKNITAYHMYKLGMTDKLPDPEESHTPFFRTPSYYEEKAQRQRQDEAGLAPTFQAEPLTPEPVKPERPDFFRQQPFDVNGQGNNPPVITQKPFVPDSRDPVGQAGQTGQYGQAGKDTPFGQKPEKDGNGQVSAPEGNTFGQQVLARIMEGMKQVEPMRVPDRSGRPLYGSGMTGELPSGQAGERQPVLPEIRNVPEKLLQRPGETHPPLVANPSAEIQKLLHVPDNEKENEAFDKPPCRTLEWNTERRNHEEDRWTSGLIPLWMFRGEHRGQAHLPDGAIETTAGLSGMKRVARDNAASPVNEVAPGWMNGASSLSGTPQVQEGSPDGVFDPEKLEAPSAGRPANKAFSSVFVTPNPDNPGFAPARVTFVDTRQFPVMKGRYLVSEDMTENINRDLTEINKGYPIGINFRFLSALEGGSGHKANIPLNRSAAVNNGDVGNQSGVTVGSGFDLGQLPPGAAGQTVLREYGFPESLVQKFSPYLGKKRLDAFRELDKKPLILSHEELDLVNRQVMTRQGNECIVQWDSTASQSRKEGLKTPYFHELTSNQQTIIFSRYYHQGPGWRSLNKAIYGSMVKNDWEGVKENLEMMIRRSRKIWPGWKRDRFTKELEFLKKPD